MYFPREITQLNYIFQFTADIHHIEVELNITADILSRVEVDGIDTVITASVQDEADH